MGPPIRIVTRGISAWLISGLAPETLACAGENQVSREGDDFGRFWLFGGPRARDLSNHSVENCIAGFQRTRIENVGDPV